jgi:hypothetical protein
MDGANNMRKEITPEDSIVPVYLEPIDNKQVEADKIEKARLDAELEAKAAQKAALLERLGITEDEARLLLG